MIQLLIENNFFQCIRQIYIRQLGGHSGGSSDDGPSFVRVLLWQGKMQGLRVMFLPLLSVKMLPIVGVFP
jgi:hypothetical protein